MCGVSSGICVWGRYEVPVLLGEFSNVEFFQIQEGLFAGMVDFEEDSRVHVQC